MRPPKSWIALCVGLVLQTVVVQTADPIWGWVATSILVIGVFFLARREIRTKPESIRNETIDQIIERLPPSLSIGTQSPSDVLQRVLQVWEEFETMNLILDRILEGVLLISNEGEILLQNQRAFTLLEIDTAFGLTTNVESLQLHKKAMKAIRKTLEGTETEVTWYRGQKPTRQYLEMVGLPLDNGGAILVVRDITTIRQLERVRRDFIANISHELRTPITTILMNTEALLDEPTEGMFIPSIHRNAERLSLLVNGLLDLSRIEAGEMELSLQRLRLLPIVERVCDTLQTLANNKKQSLQIDIPIDTFAVVDAQAMEQVLTNLVSNAIKYAPPKSLIVIRTRLINQDVMIEVEDNGQGIAPKHQQRLFERFYRVDKGRSREEGGTGLGLSIVRHLVEVMNGDVGVRSAEPKGSIFWVRIPRFVESA